MAQTKPKPPTETSLCGNCVYQPSCMFSKWAETPVLQCELHEISVPRMNGTHTTAQPYHAAQAIGLCATCDHQAHCTLRDPERVVMHCEQFE